MLTGRTSLTAEVAALIRAVETLTERQPVHRDVHARALLSPGWRAVLDRPWLRRLLVERALLGALDGGAGGVLVRARFNADAAARASTAGIRQQVILGAGLDASALAGGGFPRVFEVDHPATQALKRARLAQAVLGAGDAVTFVPHDLGQRGLETALLHAGLNVNAPVFVSWLGCIQYLDRGDVIRVLHGLHGLLAPGSELIADFLGNHGGPDSAARRLGAWLGEPLKSRFEPDEFAALLESSGFAVCELLDPATARARYFAGGRRGAVPPPVHVHVTRAVRR